MMMLMMAWQSPIHYILQLYSSVWKSRWPRPRRLLGSSETAGIRRTSNLACLTWESSLVGDSRHEDNHKKLPILLSNSMRKLNAIGSHIQAKRMI